MTTTIIIAIAVTVLFFSTYMKDFDKRAQKLFIHLLVSNVLLAVGKVNYENSHQVLGSVLTIAALIPFGFSFYYGVQILKKRIRKEDNYEK